MCFSSRPLASAIAAAAAIAVPPRALLAQQVSTETGTVHQTTSLVSGKPTGADMAGMRVSWTLTNGVTGTGVFGDLGDGFYGVASGAFKIRHHATQPLGGLPFYINVAVDGPGDGYLSSFRLNTAGAGLAIDCSFFGQDGCVNWLVRTPALVGTPGSGLGLAYQGFGIWRDQRSQVTYRNAVGVGGAAPVGDLWEEVAVSFPFGVASTGYSFLLDLDRASGPLTSGAAVPTSPVPEPATGLLAGAGALVLAAGARRRRARGTV